MEKRTEVVGDVEPGWTGFADARKVFLAFGQCAGVDEFTSGQQNKLIEESNDVAARLVDGEDDCPVVVSCKRAETLYNVERIVRIQTYDPSRQHKE